MNNEQAKSIGIGEQWVEPLNETFEKYEINTPKRQAAFIGQCMHESGGFKLLRENLNYSAKGLVATWPSRFPNLEYAAEFERKPERIANKVYSGRMGNTEEGDGAKYIGRGLIQLTGKDNYKAVTEALGTDFVANPQLLEEPRYAALSAGWFWNRKQLNKVADEYNPNMPNSPAIAEMTKKINGGLIGLSDRQAKIDMVSKYLVV